MLYYLLFWTLLGFIIHFYIIFGTNLLTEGLVQIAIFLLISVLRRKGISNGIQTEWNRRESYFWNKCDPGDLEWTSRNNRGSHEEAPGRALHHRGPLVAPPTYFFLLYIFIFPENIQEHHETLFPPPQPSVPKRSHLGAFSGAPPEGALIMEGLYINSMAPPMMCE